MLSKTTVSVTLRLFAQRENDSRRPLTSFREIFPGFLEAGAMWWYPLNPKLAQLYFSNLWPVSLLGQLEVRVVSSFFFINFFSLYLSFSYYCFVSFSFLFNPPSLSLSLSLFLSLSLSLSLVFFIYYPTFSLLSFLCFSSFFFLFTFFLLSLFFFYSILSFILPSFFFLLSYPFLFFFFLFSSDFYASLSLSLSLSQ